MPATRHGSTTWTRASVSSQDSSDARRRARRSPPDRAGAFMLGIDVPSKMPDFIPPMLATLVAAPFDDPDWSFEIKWDGFRVETVVDKDDVRLWTRGQQDAARYFGPFLEPKTWIEAREAIVDGEVI